MRRRSRLLTDLPAELILKVLSYLPIQDIHAFQFLNHRCHDVVAANEGGVYRAAAIVHRFVTEATTLEEATRNESWLHNVSSWKVLCKKHFSLEARWKGKKISPKCGLKIGRSSAAGLHAHRFKVDEEEGTIILSRAEGGIRVVSIDTDELLWELRPPYVAFFSHVEWSNGFLAFTEEGDRVEVWRRSIDAWDPDKYLPGDPLPQQLAAVSFHGPTSRPSPETPNPGRRGVYVPYTIFQAPSSCRVSRLVYPDLVMASSITQEAYIWDIPSSSLIETMEIIPHEQAEYRFSLFPPSDFIYYADISKDHVIICWGDAVVAYPRGQEDPDTLNFGSYSISNSDMIRPEGISGTTFHSFPYFDLIRGWDGLPAEVEIPLLQTTISSRKLIPTRTPQTVSQQNAVIIAAHVSPDGKDLVAVTSYPCWLVYVKDFQRRTEKGYDFRKSFRIFLSIDRMSYLAFDGKRIALGIDVSHQTYTKYMSSVYVITVEDRRFPEPTTEAQCLKPTILSLESLHSGIQFSTCIQLSDTRVWLTYPHDGDLPDIEDEFPVDDIDDPSQLCITYVDIAKVEKLSSPNVKRRRV
ncbi:hypothetical protein FRC03_006820 [Tulasnella sp. 419]|nr:hypothetical protein FRC03_006820 [Tulasnella sp. 419]